MHFSIVVLTYNRPRCLDRQLPRLVALQAAYEGVEIIVVDNASTSYELQPYLASFPSVCFIRNPENIGAVGRSSGMAAAQGEVVITLDDDVFGIDVSDLECLAKLFAQAPALGAVCFKVLDEETAAVINWCHRHDKLRYQDQAFATYEISEGAVAFRRQALQQVGFYPLDYFISHEGIDLAMRLLNAGYRIEYQPAIAVIHEHAIEGRPGWRRYYYDSRNLFWLAARYFDLGLIARRCLLQLLALAIYALRDGHLRAYGRGVYDGIAGIRQQCSQRQVATAATKAYMREADRHAPPLQRRSSPRLPDGFPPPPIGPVSAACGRPPGGRRCRWNHRARRAR